MFIAKVCGCRVSQLRKKCTVAHLWVGVFAGEVSKVTEDLALHVVFQGGEPAVGLLVHGVMQLQELHQLLRLHLQGREQF